MAVVSITGAQFTCKIGTTDYSSQVTGGTITASPTIARTKTLGDVAYPMTDLVHEVDVEFLYDDEAGFVGQINTAAIAGTGLVTEIKGADSKWTGTLYTTGLEVKFAADGVAMATGKFIGALVLADVTP
jgi:hypothetical protein